MSEKLDPNKNSYTYECIQSIANPSEKRQIKYFANNENFKNTSEFVIRITFDYIRRQENFKLFPLLIHLNFMYLYP
jgi:hypothetical protein